ncbi:MAG: class I SAM-dependent methyltransferase [Desulfobacterales bacterium]|jgi:SAM-dependent methyltransferase|nr:class I SAM-dependent methyltransferase [Desulfobacterales bacterium]
MKSDRLKWNERYRRQEHPGAPAAVVREFARLAPGRRALDIAAGNGRHALYLAGQGFRVDAVDIADAGLSLFAGRHPAVRIICADLELFDIPAARYDLIVDVLYLNRRLFPQICEGLAPGGILIFETLVAAPGSAAEEGHCRDYLLRENELLHAFLSLNVIYYREGGETGREGERVMAALVAVKK